MPRLPLTLVGTAGTAVGCAAMAASLPTAASGALGIIGISGSGAFARALGGAAQPIFIVSALLLIAGGLACSRVVAGLAAVAGLLLYLSMFEFSGSAHGGSNSMSAMTMSQPHAARANPVAFYVGLAALLLSMTAQIWRRRRGVCRPVLRLRRAI